MSTLLAIEENFLNNAEIKTALKLTEIKRHLNAIENGQKKKFAQTLELSKVVKTSYEWFTSEEGQRKASEEGISWNAEKFAKAIFGWEKSFFHKVLKASKLEETTIETFNAKCTELEVQRKKSNRSLEGLLKFAKELENNTQASGQSEGEGEGEGEGENTPSVERAEIRIVFTFKDFNGVNVSVRVDANGEAKTNNTKEQIQAAIQLFQSCL